MDLELMPRLRGISFWLMYLTLNFRFSSPVRRRVAQAGQGMSARTDETTSHSTKLASDASQVAGYV
ncbi:hypothetical protein [Ferrigenium kumadai]|uniref:hypothetical protein n=1 Tax=Ferrigenium kumadai TaxID=1682490 RepID=UPI001BB3241B|nr:hypothetical protein [Ferrigenium kumadai]